MKAAMRQVTEIKRLEKAIQKTNSIYLKKDYSKRIRTLKAELMEYCDYRGFDFNWVMNNAVL